MGPPLYNVRIREVYSGATVRIVHPSVEIPQRPHVVEHQSADHADDERVAAELPFQIVLYPLAISPDAGGAQHDFGVTRVEAKELEAAYTGRGWPAG